MFSKDVARGSFSFQVQAFMKRHFTTRTIVEAGMMLALTTVLGQFKLYTSPFGGSVTAGAMIPLLLLAMLRGPVVGINYVSRPQ